MQHILWTAHWAMWFNSELDTVHFCYVTVILVKIGCDRLGCNSLGEDRLDYDRI